MEDTGMSLRPYITGDEDASVALWLRSWQAAYPTLDFAARLDWWRERWRNELVPCNEIVIAESANAMIGFVTVDPQTLYLDQLVVAPESWGAGVGEALSLKRNVFRRRVSISTSTPTTRARLRSTASMDLRLPVKEKIRSAGNRFTG
jgi:putative acetyltransferase